MIQITDDRAPNGRHLRVQHTYGCERRLLLLDPAREGEVDGDPAARRHGGGSSGIPAGLRQAQAGRRGFTGGRGRRQGLWCSCPPSPFYIGPLGGRRPSISHIEGGAAARGGGLPPKPSGAPPPPGFPTLGAGEAHGGRTSPPGAGSPPTSAHGALQDRWPHPVDPRDPSGDPGTIPMNPKTFPMAETRLPIYNSLPPDHSGTPHDVRDLIWDSEQLSVYYILISLQP